MKKFLINTCIECPHHFTFDSRPACSLANDKYVTMATDFLSWCKKHGYPVWCPLPDDDSDVAQVILGWIREKSGDLAATKTHLIRKIQNKYLGVVEKRGKNAKKTM